MDSNELQTEHETLAQSQGYRNNNWLLGAPTEMILSAPRGSLLEVGCGNGRFLAKVANNFKKITGLDFVKNPNFDANTSQYGNINFVKESLLTYNITGPSYDLVVSADVLEHLDESTVNLAVKRLNTLGKVNFHRIACYAAPGHHTVKPPEWWESEFKKVSSDFRILHVERRPGSGRGKVVTIYNGVQ